MNQNNTENTPAINLKLTVDEVNLILETLGTQPFAKVYTLIGRIQEEASTQLNGASETVEAESVELEETE